MLIGLVRNTQLKFRRKVFHCIRLPVEFIVKRKLIKTHVLYSTWYIFNFSQIFDFFETHPNVSWVGQEYSAKVLAKGLPLY